MPQPPGTEKPLWVVLIGGSAGALVPLQQILANWDPTLPAAVLVVQHTPAERRSRLAHVLARTSVLPVFAIQGRTELRPGSFYLAPPDYHLRVSDGVVEPWRGPREHHTRPAIDVLFRSAARVYRNRAVGVILSGYGGDGSSGSVAIHANGGFVIAQAPAEAEVASMPQRAIGLGHVDQVCAAADIPSQVRAHILAAVEGAPIMKGAQDDIRRKIAEDIKDQESGQRNGMTATFSCPDCGGVLWQDQQGRMVDFTCHIGHRWTSDTLLVQKTENLEAALLSAQRLLKEKAMLLQQTAARARGNGYTRAAERLAEQAALDQSYAELIERELLQAEPSPLSNAVIEEEVQGADDPAEGDRQAGGSK